ncbi:ATP phosphoribosyltransferase regulatory subunit [Polycladomyces subterraneus]|uniref:ATP phosphoribosyltransferase regulatory subunit n=1 Tax=Polycladomyces subterraneus TaxID=1016997 RepID=A0ABT8INN3_9BACL|nr:ATP phosphoribosyltransferase regulatory subunit [Polycladomyces subterraneus]MDN4594357.1 ATP phosphoribosyltransferase regulatory subunit [Polycladomyces subterraneus]
MPKPREFEKPTGFRDFPPSLAAKKRAVEQRIHRCFERWGYQEVITPTLEYHDTVGRASAIPEEKLFKLIDREGKTLVLRPDQTAPIARVVGSVLREVPVPLRLLYHGSVFRAQERSAGRNAEFFQSGVELVGEASPEAEAEVIALAVETIRACGLDAFQLAVGHVGLLDGVLRQAVADEDAVYELKESLGARNVVGFFDLLERFSLPDSVKRELTSLLQVRRNPSELMSINLVTSSPETQAAVERLSAMWSSIDDFGVTPYVVLDLGLVGSLGYYTGIYFEGYTASLGFPVLSGGSYDRLLERFDRPLPATGFAVKLDRVMEAGGVIEPQERRVAVLYDRSRRSEAIRVAERMREQGHHVVLQWRNDQGGHPSDDWLALFDEVIRIGEEEGR